MDSIRTSAKLAHIGVLFFTCLDHPRENRAYSSASVHLRYEHQMSRTDTDNELAMAAFRAGYQSGYRDGRLENENELEEA